MIKSAPKSRNSRVSIAAKALLFSSALFVAAPTESAEAPATSIEVAASTEYDRWGNFDQGSAKRIDHSPMTSLLQAIAVKDRGKEAIAYSSVTGQALSYVKGYIRILERVEVSTLNKDEQLAYWLNLHNAGVIKLLSEDKKAYRKVKKFRGTPAKPGKEWTEKVFRVEGQELSLHDIEQNILARHWDDPLFIYGLCYGVQGSPSIGKVAFNGRNVKKQLAANAATFVNSSKNVKVSKKGAQVSSLYEWNKAALFSGDDAAVLTHISTYAKPKLAKRLAAVSKINKHRFNWKTNAFIPRAQNAGGFGGGGFGGGGGGGGGGYGGGS